MLNGAFMFASGASDAAQHASAFGLLKSRNVPAKLAPLCTGMSRTLRKFCFQLTTVGFQPLLTSAPKSRLGSQRVHNVVVRNVPKLMLIRTASGTSPFGTVHAGRPGAPPRVCQAGPKQSSAANWHLLGARTAFIWHLRPQHGERRICCAHVGV